MRPAIRIRQAVGRVRADPDTLGQGPVVGHGEDGSTAIRAVAEVRDSGECDEG